MAAYVPTLVNLGTAPNARDGDPARTWAGKNNTNANAIAAAINHADGSILTGLVDARGVEIRKSVGTGRYWLDGALAGPAEGFRLTEVGVGDVLTVAPGAAGLFQFQGTRRVRLTGDPAHALDAATRQYVDARVPVAGLTPLHHNNLTVSTTEVSDAARKSYIVPGGTLDVDGSALLAVAWGTQGMAAADSVTNFRARFVFAGVALSPDAASVAATAADSGLYSWVITAWIYRTGASAFRARHDGIMVSPVPGWSGSATSGRALLNTAVSAGTPDLAVNQTLAVHGASVSGLRTWTCDGFNVYRVRGT